MSVGHRISGIKGTIRRKSEWRKGAWFRFRGGTGYVGKSNTRKKDDPSPAVHLGSRSKDRKFLLSLKPLVPFIILSTEDGILKGEDYTIITKLKAERVLATIWDRIRRKVCFPPYIMYIPISPEGSKITFEDKEQTEYNHMYGPEDPPLQEEDLDP